MIKINLPLNTEVAKFVRRDNRFVATIQVDGRQYKAHVPSSGRMQELLVEGAELLVTPSPPQGKTDYKILLVKYQQQWVSIDSLLPNKIIRQALNSDQLTELAGYGKISGEQSFGNSRFDFLLQQGNQRDCFLEVKSVTLVEQGVAIFPDAPSERGTKHLHHLIEAVQRGYRGVVFFVVQRNDAQKFRPNALTDKNFAEALTLAVASGVEVYARKCVVSTTEILLGDYISVDI